MVSFSFKFRLFPGHVQQGNEQSPISHKAKRRKVQEDKQGKIEKLGRIKRTAKKLGGEREQNCYIVGSILCLNLYFLKVYYTSSSKRRSRSTLCEFCVVHPSLRG